MGVMGQTIASEYKRIETPACWAMSFSSQHSCQTIASEYKRIETLSRFPGSFRFLRVRPLPRSIRGLRPDFGREFAYVFFISQTIASEYKRIETDGVSVV